MRRSIRILLPLLVDSGESVRVLRFREKIQSGCLAFLVGVCRDMWLMMKHLSMKFFDRAAASHSVTAMCIVGLVFLLSACQDRNVTLHQPPVIESAEFVGNSSCETCHAEKTRIFGASLHGMFHKADLDGLERSGETGCESCHGAGSLHAASGGREPGLIVNPGRNPEACLKCHITQHSQFQFPYHHPVLEGRMSCVDCHDPHGPHIFRPAGGMVVRENREFCGRCHPSTARPFIFEHAAMADGCQTCHQVHGAANRKLLTAPGPNLCLRCHAQVAGPAVASGNVFIGAVDHSAYISQGTCWSSGCHTAVHGSNVHPTLLY